MGLRTLQQNMLCADLRATSAAGIANAEKGRISYSQINFEGEADLKTYSVLFAVTAISACTATAPVVQYASPNGIALRYKAYDEVPTLTAEAREIAVQYCAKNGMYANYKGGNAVSPFSAEEVHQFACEATKVDDSAIIAAQSVRPAYIAVPIYQSPEIDD